MWIAKSKTRFDGGLLKLVKGSRFLLGLLNTIPQNGYNFRRLGSSKHRTSCNDAVCPSWSCCIYGWRSQPTIHLPTKAKLTSQKPSFIRPSVHWISTATSTLHRVCAILVAYKDCNQKLLARLVLSFQHINLSWEILRGLKRLVIGTMFAKRVSSYIKYLTRERIKPELKLTWINSTTNWEWFF